MRKTFQAMLSIAVCLLLVSCGRKRDSSREAAESKGSPGREASTRAPEDEAREPKSETAEEVAAPAWEELVNTIGMKFRPIPPGSFIMGDDAGTRDQKPAHKVTLTKKFHIGVYEVTQEEWEKVMGSNPSQFKQPNNPVERVTWNEALEFARKLSQKEKVTYRLPTEAEWEYACRAGTTTQYYWGDDPDNAAGDYAWYEGNSDGTTHPTGEKKPNAWGLYDMSGNVGEWCADWYSERYPADEEAVDPKGAAGGTFRAFRNGSWVGGANDCRSAYRGGYLPSNRYGIVGFRLVRETP